MLKLPRVRASEVIIVLERLGFVQVRQRGSHVILKRQLVQEGEGQKTIEVGCVVPLHRKTIAVGTLKSILSQAGVSVEEFLENL
ncbi:MULTISPECIES: type II toxin-antitoxin system HicA family toxin [Nostoc]|uniref:Type II toxin-antitoxin system HicA family toxin n=1 Tax=Nostoc paludosum FACHB-159 TaxID=2692908 RepID=A0ABR8KF15_9NOSO|nr:MULTISPECIES: type II toxin-antitoxin system HicA family toxin [Nostoc]MBD2681690.1 type II toxin-antitoxin system HicA family toxin [Nostoc sp. FACHB-857]MBD2738154.1 type II toxin-antitoxin system HicA family toxin [Nostoc paludosum FACHB-159]